MLFKYHWLYLLWNRGWLITTACQCNNHHANMHLQFVQNSPHWSSSWKLISKWSHCHFAILLGWSWPSRFPDRFYNQPGKKLSGCFTTEHGVNSHFRKKKRKKNWQNQRNMAFLLNKWLKNPICLRIPTAPSHSSVWPFRKTLFA